MTTNAAGKKPATKDWHPADVIAALRKAGWSLQQLAFQNGYTARTALANALHRPYPKAERIIATTLELEPQQIWPSRYNANGETNRPPGAKPRRPVTSTIEKTQPSTAVAGRNAQSSKAA